MQFHTITLKNAQGTSKKNSFLVDETEIQEPQLETENQDSTIIRIRIKNMEDPTSTKILTIRSRTKNEVDPTSTKILTTRSRTKTKLLTKNLCSTIILASVEITNPKYPIANSPTIELIMDGKLLDETRTHLFTSIATFCFFVEIISNKKDVKRALVNRCQVLATTHFEIQGKRMQKWHH
jgi:hypothetical protein